MMNRNNLALMILLANHLTPVTAEPITAVLDGYEYEIYDDVIIDTENNIITIDSNMLSCEQPNNDPPLENTLYALHNINDANQFIGLNQIIYKTNLNTLFFTSETSNLTCTNGVYVDTIYAGGFE